jgi:ABC-2 type transport system ATP-binding protein
MVRDVTQIETRGMTPEQITKLRAACTDAGLPDPVVTHPTTTLEDLFMRLVRENTAQADGKSGSYTGSVEQ